MPEIVVPVPKELEEEFKKFDTLLLQLAIQKLIRKKFEEFAKVEKILSRSKLTEREAIELSRKVNKSLAERYEKLR